MPIHTQFRLPRRNALNHFAQDGCYAVRSTLSQEDCGWSWDTHVRTIRPLAHRLCAHWIRSRRRCHQMRCTRSAHRATRPRNVMSVWNINHCHTQRMSETEREKEQFAGLQGRCCRWTSEPNLEHQKGEVRVQVEGIINFAYCPHRSVPSIRSST